MSKSISIEDLRELAGQMKLGNGDIEDNTVFHVYGDAISVLTDLWNFAHELGHSDERACAEAEMEERDEEFAIGSFVRITGIRNRICNTHKCENCPLYDVRDCEGLSAYGADSEKAAEFAKIVMDWAKQNPEIATVE